MLGRRCRHCCWCFRLHMRRRRGVVNGAVGYRQRCYPPRRTVACVVVVVRSLMLLGHQRCCVVVSRRTVARIVAVTASPECAFAREGAVGDRTHAAVVIIVVALLMHDGATPLMIARRRRSEYEQVSRDFKKNRAPADSSIHTAHAHAACFDYGMTTTTTVRRQPHPCLFLAHLAHPLARYSTSLRPSSF